MTSAPQALQSRFTKRFQQLQERKQFGIMPFTLLGWPTLEKSEAILSCFGDNQEHIAGLELGLPFSDPVSDGPVIAKAAHDTLASGFHVDDALELLTKTRARFPELPITLMCYYNMVMARGIERFCKEVAQAGVDGLLIVDLPPEAYDEVAPFAQAAGLSCILIVSPLTTSERLEHIAQYASGYLYVVSRLGITGTEARYDQDLQSLLENLQPYTLPKYVGFGISTAAHVQKMANLGADGVIIGSQIIKLVNESDQNTANWLQPLKDYLQTLVP